MTPETRRKLPLFAGIAAAIALLLGGAYTCSHKEPSDRISDRQVGAAQGGDGNLVGENRTAPAVDPAKRCASGATYALVKQELFRRAAQIRGKDDALFDRIAAAAALRVERPVVTSRDEGLGNIACGASVSVDLPPGLTVAGGRTSLVADIGYAVQPAADGSGDVVVLTGADAITVPLATIGRVAQASPPIDPLAPIAPSAPGTVPPPVPTPRPAAPVVPPSPPRSAATASPSFDCANARSSGERMICADPGLAAIDRQMAAQYRAAYAAASPEGRGILRSTAHHFYGFRDNCPTARCIADGYRERMREIDAIMADDR